MKFRKVATIGNVGGICGVAITIVLSFLMRNVWALMIGFCAESAARCVLSYVVCPYLPSLRWNKEAARDLVRFSRGVFGLSFLNLIFARTDIFVLAKLFSPAALGLYTMAIYLVQTPTNFLMNMLGQTLLPAFSAVQTDTGRTNRILSQVNTLLALAGVPALAFMLFSGHSVLRLAYGPRYEAMGASLALASAVSLVNLLNGQITTVFYARGVPQLHRRAVAFMALVMAAVVYPLAKWLGPVGGQVACLIAVVVGFVLQTERLRDVTALKLTGYANALGASVLASLCVVALGLGARPFAALSHPLPNILVGALGCLMAYTLTAVILLRGHRTLLKVGP
jgi:PST family polysaccharide transporter